MNFLTIFLISLSLAADAFTVSITGGITCKKNRIRNSIKMALFFGIFQSLMPLLGFFLGKNISFINSYDKITGFIILLFIGIKMIYEGIKSKEEDISYFSLKMLFLLAIATSIDAFAIGIVFITLKINIILPIIIIGIITFVLSLIGFFIGEKIGHFSENKMEILAGIILIGIGIKILIF